MESRVLIDLSIKYGLNSAQTSKLADISYQAGLMDLESREFKRMATYICEDGMIDDPAEEIIEELKLKGLISE